MKKLSQAIAGGVVAAGLSGAIVAGTASASTVATHGTSTTSHSQHMAPNFYRSGQTAAFIKSLPTLREGSSGTVVLGLQLGLRNNGYTSLSGTGHFGVDTATALIKYKQTIGLPGTAVADQSFWLNVVQQSRRAGLNPQLSPGAVITANGSFTRQGYEVLGDTTALSSFPWFSAGRAGEWYEYGKPGTVPTLKYEGLLLNGVKGFQQRVGISPTGVVGEQTRFSLSIVTALGYGIRES